MEKHQKNWDRLYNSLVQFIKTNNKFPDKKDDQKLYTWCAVQRLKKKRNNLSKEKEEKLHAVNFVWDIQKEIWEKNYDLLVEYRNKNSKRWPSQRSKEPLEHKLAVWFLGIRKDYKNKKLSKERIEKLKKIQFPFYPREHRWQNNFDSLEKWLAKTGKFPERASKDAMEQKLFNWCRYQSVKLKYDVLEEYQKKKLEDIGIQKFIEELKKFDIVI
ncbi:MAG: helicase associated domain-containing protein [Spirochaetia bacterium]|nr:helicase associated domain-containing protein [Spirochaetia bacterium]